MFKTITLMEQKLLTMILYTKNLRIILSNNLDWSDHYHNITAKPYKILSLLRCCIKTDSINAKRKLYFSLVRSHLLRNK